MFCAVCRFLAFFLLCFCFETSPQRVEERFDENNQETGQCRKLC